MKLPLFLFAIAFCLCSFVSVAFAQSEGHADPKILMDLYNAVVNGQLGWLSGLAMIVAIEPAKRLLKTRLPFLGTDIGGVILAFSLAAVTGCAHALVVSAPWSLDLVMAILRNAVVAIGGYAAIKKTLVAKFPFLSHVIGAPLAPTEPAKVTA